MVWDVQSERGNHRYCNDGGGVVSAAEAHVCPQDDSTSRVGDLSCRATVLFNVRDYCSRHNFKRAWGVVYVYVCDVMDDSDLSYSSNPLPSQ
jgi:hypothetical protein